MPLNEKKSKTRGFPLRCSFAQATGRIPRCSTVVSHFVASYIEA
jgi:hypothetical protein